MINFEYWRLEQDEDGYIHEFILRQFRFEVEHLLKGVEDWCVDNFGLGGFDEECRWVGTGPLDSYWFRSETDAMMFRIRWG